MKGIGQERDFYSAPDDPSLDDALTRVETTMAETVRQLASGDVALLDVSACATLVGALSVRTKAMRRAMIDVLPIVIEEAAKELADLQNTRQALKKHANDKRWLHETVSKEMAKLPRMSREQASRMRKTLETAIRVGFNDPDSPCITEAHEGLQLAAAKLIKEAGAIADGAFKAALKNDPTMTLRAEQLRQCRFEIIEAEESYPFILGDCAVVARYTDGMARLPFSSIEDQLYPEIQCLPVSPRRCLTLRRDSKIPLPKASEINAWSAALSHEFFISHSATFSNAECLRKLINTADPIDTEDRIRSYLVA